MGDIADRLWAPCRLLLPCPAGTESIGHSHTMSMDTVSAP
jgi:hypothetical protein